MSNNTYSFDSFAKHLFNCFRSWKGQKNLEKPLKQHDLKEWGAKGVRIDKSMLNAIRLP